MFQNHISIFFEENGQKQKRLDLPLFIEKTSLLVEFSVFWSYFHTLDNWDAFYDVLSEQNYTQITVVFPKQENLQYSESIRFLLEILKSWALEENIALDFLS